ncbi:MAG: tetratricopeptide repeat protein, partial [Alphaproteobacteria bacterium]
RAIARGAQGKDFEALDDLNRAVDLAPRNADARILRAAASRRVGAGDLAALDLDAALAIDPEAPAAWLERGLLAESRKQTAAARAAFAKAVALDPEGPSGLTARAALARLSGVDAR